MVRAVFLLLFLMPSAVQAALTTLSLQVTPATNLLTQGATVQATASSDGTGMEYRFVLSHDTGAVVLSTAWGTGNAFEIITGSVLTPSGNYRLAVLAREAANPAARLQKTRTLRIRTAEEVSQANAEKVQARFARAVKTVRDDLRQVIAWQGTRWHDVTELYVRYSSNTYLIGSSLQPLATAAPGGGPAWVAGSANAEAGAIGVEIVAPPASQEDWWDAEVRLHLPAYEGLVARTEIIRYDSVLSAAEEQAQRDLVDARYAMAVARTRTALIEVISRQGKGRDVTTECGNFAGANELITNVLNRFAIMAPRGGSAFVDGQGVAATGAVGIEMVAGCADPQNWWETAVRIHRPAFLGLTAADTWINYNTVLSPEAEQAQRDLIDARYNLAIAQVRTNLLRVIRWQAEGRDVTGLCASFADGSSLIDSVLNRSSELAPRGGNAFLDGLGEAATGAVGIEMVAGCTDSQNWWETAVRIHRPAFLGLTAADTWVTYRTVLSPTQEQAQRDLVSARYQQAIATLRERLHAVKAKLAASEDVSLQFSRFASTADLIDSVLNKSQMNAPRGGNAFIESNTGEEFTGAIGIELPAPPAAVDDWNDMEIRVHLPAFLGLTPATEIVRFDE